MKRIIIPALLIILTLTGCGADNSVKNACRGVVVIDAGHGKPSSRMSAQEKAEAGYVYNERARTWGDWRHYKNGEFGVDCEGSGCTHRGDCFYPMTHGDRDTEPELNLNNAFAAKKYLEEMGYEVRMTRQSNDENPSMNARVSHCFKDGDMLNEPDAKLYVCLHTNAGGGRGTSYIRLEGNYAQRFADNDYVQKSNRAGEIINGKIAALTGLRGNAPISGREELVLFNKCPVPIAYIEAGFYDDKVDLEIIKASHDDIGKAVAEGVDEFIKDNAKIGEDTK